MIRRPERERREAHLPRPGDRPLCCVPSPLHPQGCRPGRGRGSGKDASPSSSTAQPSGHPLRLRVTTQAPGTAAHPKCFELTLKNCAGAASAQEGHRRVLHGSCWDAAKGLLGSQGLPLFLQTAARTEQTERRALERAGRRQRHPWGGAPSPGGTLALALPSLSTRRLASLS